jgi:hypothetical protein
MGWGRLGDSLILGIAIGVFPSANSHSDSSANAGPDAFNDAIWQVPMNYQSCHYSEDTTDKSADEGIFPCSVRLHDRIIPDLLWIAEQLLMIVNDVVGK